MPPKGAKMVFPALRGKQTRLDGACSSGGLDEARTPKEGTCGAAATEKKMGELEITSLYQQLRQAEGKLMHCLRKGEESITIRAEISVLKAKANQKFSNNAAFKYQKFKAERYEYGESTEKILARWVR
ncbi:hypothetical protein NDU88_000240 [Pleurodeles waltl]|uniref:Uncharacterized protein n=1 Tax=Pleurodeles waltl TaxID=8319 RepID=A0AAV7UQH9_PLEWA|nr:hypothetical protein NDU88_000240 [Pleurodeles waltl]